jgi:DNA polymerase/3'-5' exonuclease PolX
MKNKETWHPAGAARAVADELMVPLAPFCAPERLAVAGSLRRGAARVHDLEICYVSRIGPARRSGDLLESLNSLADLKLEEWLCAGLLTRRPSTDGGFAWGKLNKLAVHVPSGLPVDFFSADADTWWRTLALRTGPKEFNLRLIAGAAARGLKLHAYGPAFKDTTSGEVMACASEEEFLAMCGMEWIKPEDRK